MYSDLFALVCTGPRGVLNGFGFLIVAAFFDVGVSRCFTPPFSARFSPCLLCSGLGGGGFPICNISFLLQALLSDMPQLQDYLGESSHECRRTYRKKYKHHS